jgi:Fe-S-cluster-containing hydrogenase component 2
MIAILGCKGCEACVEVCRFDAIVIVNGRAKVDVAKCVECYECVEACPFGSIVVVD